MEKRGPKQTFFFYFGPLLNSIDIGLKSQVFVNMFTTRMVLPAQELFAIEKMATQEDREHAGLAAVDNEAVVAVDNVGPTAWR